MSEHTPGPWAVNERTLQHVQGADGYLVAGCAAGAAAGRMDAECEANARLIAAAPQLLEAAEAVIADVDRIVTSLSTRTEPLSVFDPLRAAIAAARGEAVAS